MTAADRPVQRPADARLLLVDAMGRIGQLPRAQVLDALRPGDLVVANDAATLPASLRATHVATGEPIEVRLAGQPWRAHGSGELNAFHAVVFGRGDFRTPTEQRPLPPPLAAGDVLVVGPLRATIAAVLDHPRLVLVRFDGSMGQIWEGISRHGRPIQYAHLAEPLALWHVWTPVASTAVAFEAPSAGFALDWAMLRAMRDRRISFATITHAAGLSSTGDPALDRRLPLDEPYRIPVSTVDAVCRANARAGRVIAIGTTVVRALEHAASRGRLHAGDDVADHRIGPATRLRVVDAVLSGVHEEDTSHYQLLRAFVGDETLERATEVLRQGGYRTHEFGDSVLVERRPAAARARRCPSRPSPRVSRMNPSDRGVDIARTLIA